MRQALLVSLLSLVLGGCEQHAYLWTCEDPPCEDACGCAPLPAEWSRPVTVWSGPESDAPPCPGAVAWEGRAPFAGPPGCPTCACGPAEATCTPPAMWEARSERCADGAPYVTDLSPPAGWDGSCTTAGAIAAGEMCGGGPCVRSVDIGPPVVTLAACEPMADAVPAEGALSAFVRACEAPRDACAGGWCGEARDCVFLRGEHECPAPWDERRVYVDTVPEPSDCTPCECGPPTGGSCEASATLYTDGSCVTMALDVAQVPAGGGCYSIADGIALGSKSAAVVSTTPGSCVPSGGEMTAEPAEPVTFCCR